MVKMIAIVGGVLGVLAIQVGLFLFFFSAPAPAAGGAEPDAAAQKEPEDEAPSYAEVKVGDRYRTTNNKAAADVSIHVDFELVVLVPTPQRQQFVDKLKEHEHRIRQAIIKIARSSSMEDLNDPNLGAVKRLVKEEINKILVKSYVQEVVISDFTTIVQ